MAATAAQKARNVRKDALREFLSNQKLIEHVIELAKKIEGLSQEGVLVEIQQAIKDNPDVSPDLVIASYRDKLEFDLKKYSKSADINLKLINKYLGDEKSVESTVELINDGADNLSDSVLAHIAAAGSTGATDETGGEEKPSSVH